MTIGDADDIGNLLKYKPRKPENQPSGQPGLFDAPIECGADEASGVARRDSLPEFATSGDGLLTIGHISPLGVDPSEFWQDSPQSTQFRNSTDCLVSVDGDSASVEWTPDGSFIKVKKDSLHAVKSSLRQQSKRGIVSGFSRKSRTRLLQVAAGVKRSALPFFIGLTYPGKDELVPYGDIASSKKDLDKFLKRL